MYSRYRGHSGHGGQPGRGHRLPRQRLSCRRKAGEQVSQQHEEALCEDPGWGGRLRWGKGRPVGLTLSSEGEGRRSGRSGQSPRPVGRGQGFGLYPKTKEATKRGDTI